VPAANSVKTYVSNGRKKVKALSSFQLESKTPFLQSLKRHNFSDSQSHDKLASAEGNKCDAQDLVIESRTPDFPFRSF
jgi:hypothetical protein